MRPVRSSFSSASFSDLRVKVGILALGRVGAAEKIQPDPNYSLRELLSVVQGLAQGGDFQEDGQAQAAFALARELEALGKTGGKMERLLRDPASWAGKIEAVPQHALDIKA